MNIKQLRKELDAAGVFEKREAQSWAKITFLLALVAAMTVAHFTLPLWASVLLLPLTTVFSVTIAMMGHEGAHKALSRSGWRNELMAHLAFAGFSGLGVQYWKYKHNVKHHAHTNIVEEDLDLNLWPMASSAAQYQESGPARRWFQRNCQGFMFWPLTSFLAWSMRFSTWQYTIKYAMERGIDRRWLVDVGSMLLHLVLWVVLPAVLISPWAILYYVAVWTLAGPMLAAIFAPAHMSLPILTEHQDKWMLQFETTRDLAMPAWMSWFFVGLDHQLEHHLFPRIPHQNMRKAAQVTQAWAAREGVPYYQVGYFTGLWDVTRYMAVAWKLDPTDGEHISQWDAHRSERNLSLSAQPQRESNSAAPQHAQPALP